VKIHVAVLVLVAAGCATRTYRRNQDYSDELRFWEATTKASPNSFKPHGELALQCCERGNLDCATREIERAQTIVSTLPDRYGEPLTWMHAAQIYGAIGQTEKARIAAERMVRILNAQQKP
jgi:Tfp pilus assembly protein PilF